MVLLYLLLIFLFHQVLNGHATSICGILLSPCQQLWCLVCCAPVYDQSLQRRPTVSLHCHFLALYFVVVHTTLPQLQIHIFCTSPNEEPHRLYYIVMCSTMRIFNSAITFLIVSSLSPYDLHRGEAPCCSMLLYMFTAVSVYSCAAIKIPLFPFSTFLSLTSFKFVGSWLHLFTS